MIDEDHLELLLKMKPNTLDRAESVVMTILQQKLIYDEPDLSYCSLRLYVNSLLTLYSKYSNELQLKENDCGKTKCKQDCNPLNSKYSVKL